MRRTLADTRRRLVSALAVGLLAVPGVAGVAGANGSSALAGSQGAAAHSRGKGNSRQMVASFRRHGARVGGFLAIVPVHCAGKVADTCEGTIRIVGRHTSQIDVYSIPRGTNKGVHVALTQDLAFLIHRVKSVKVYASTRTVQPSGKIVKRHRTITLND